MLRAGPVRVVEAKLPRQTQTAVPAAQHVARVVFLVVSGIADALRDVPGILLRVRVVRAVAVRHVVRPGEGVLAIRANNARVDSTPRAKVVLPAHLPKMCSDPSI